MKHETQFEYFAAMATQCNKFFYLLSRGAASPRSNMVILPKDSSPQTSCSFTDVAEFHPTPVHPVHYSYGVVLPKRLLYEVGAATTTSAVASLY